MIAIWEYIMRHARWAAGEHVRSGCRRACSWAGGERRWLYEIWHKAFIICVVRDIKQLCALVAAEKGRARGQVDRAPG